MLRKFGAGIVLGIFPACGGQVDIGGASEHLLNVGGSTSSTGGTTSISIGATGGSPSATTGGVTSNFTSTAGGIISVSTGGSTAIDPNCNGLLLTNNCRPAPIVLVTSCDAPLQYSPPGPGFVQVVLDCGIVPPADPDAGILDGYYIDYNQSPVHLVLLGAYCTHVLTNGGQSSVVFEACRYI